MVAKDKLHHHQSLNPFLGFGWFTTTKSVRKDLKIDNSSYSAKDTHH